jgi:hypothetical protein
MCQNVANFAQIAFKDMNAPKMAAHPFGPEGGKE